MLSGKLLLLIVVQTTTICLATARPFLPDLSKSSSEALERDTSLAILRFEMLESQRYHTHSSYVIPRLLRSWKSRVFKHLDQITSPRSGSSSKAALPINVFRQEEKLRIDASADLTYDVTSAAGKQEQPRSSQALSHPEQQVRQSSRQGRDRLAPLPRERPNYSRSSYAKIH